MGLSYIGIRPVTARSIILKAVFGLLALVWIAAALVGMYFLFDVVFRGAASP